ncbi:MAG TPA: NAD(P)-binding domain-containing protein [Ilumatobacteraceae bacterium]|nr:NAD(P)-binding domain-containing protein [Ilumatobacteraceae bacterium]
MDTTTVIIGAGHAGLAMSRQLSEHSIDHVVLERGEVANSWRTERWDSLRLLTPNWQTSLPGKNYRGNDPDGFMTMPEVAELIGSYAAGIDAPVQTGTTVSRVAATETGYQVVTDRGVWTCATVVLASGACSLVNVPAIAAATPSAVAGVTPLTYRSPDQLEDAGVLVVGGSATGLQLADEIHRSGRQVTLAVGEHVRMPRTYRGRDVFWWMEAAGVLDERYDEVDDLVRARHVPSPQLIGTPDRRSLDLNSLAELGVEIVGRLGAIRDGVALFSGGLANTCRLADLKLNRLLDRFDDWERRADAGVLEPPHRLEPTSVGARATLEVDLRRRSIGTILWATGFRPDHSWLDVPVLDHKGRVRHDGGIVTDAPGMYLLGGSLLRTRRSSYIAGAEHDTDALASHLHDYLASPGTHHKLKLLQP